MVRDKFLVTDPEGLHARPASELAKAAMTFKSNITLIVGDKKVNAKSILAVMSLGAKNGAEIEIECEGEDEELALQKLLEILKNS